MVKKINVSISDALFERAEKWKDQYSPSELYQNALEAFVSKKEQLDDRMKGELETMEKTIKRLKKQKRAAEGDFQAVGQDWGTTWARRADYSDLKYAAEGFNPHEGSRIYSHKLFSDRILGKHFRDMAKELREKRNLDPFTDEDDYGDMVGLVSVDGKNLIKSWLEAVRAFWEKVLPELND